MHPHATALPAYRLCLVKVCKYAIAEYLTENSAVFFVHQQSTGSHVRSQRRPPQGTTVCLQHICWPANAAVATTQHRVGYTGGRPTMWRMDTMYETRACERGAAHHLWEPGTVDAQFPCSLQAAAAVCAGGGGIRPQQVDERVSAHARPSAHCRMHPNHTRARKADVGWVRAVSWPSDSSKLLHRRPCCCAGLK